MRPLEVAGPLPPLAPTPESRGIVVGTSLAGTVVGAGTAVATGLTSLPRASLCVVLFTAVWIVAIIGLFTERGTRIWRTSGLAGASLAAAHAVTWVLLWKGSLAPLAVAPVVGAACGALVGSLWGLSKGLMKLWPLAGALAGAATVLLFGWVWFTLLVIAMLSPPFGDRGFDPSLWRSEARTTDRDSPRGRMVGDIRDRVVRPGMTRAEVRTLLGVPDWESARPDEDHWRIGMWTGFRMDEDTLLVRYAPDDRVRDVHVVQH